QGIGASGMEGEEALDVDAVDGAGTGGYRPTRTYAAVAIGSADPLIAVGFVGPGIAGDIKALRAGIVGRRGKQLRSSDPDVGSAAALAYHPGVGGAVGDAGETNLEIVGKHSVMVEIIARKI